MSGWIEGTNSSSQPRYTQLNLQTSALNTPIPLVWGKKRVGTNVIWYNDFYSRSDGKKGGGKGGGGKGSGVYDYWVAVILALCEGPITGVGTVWADKQIVTLADLGFTLFTGTASQAVWSYLTSKHPDQAIPYAYTAYLANSSYALGKSPNLPNHSFEVITPLSGSMPGFVDVNMADVIEDFLTNVQYSIALPSSSIDSTSLSLYKTYCQAANLMFSPDLNQQEQVSSVLDRWAKITNTWIFWSGSALKFVPLGDTTIANGTVSTVSIITSVPQDPGPYTFTGIPNVTANGGVSYQNGGALTLVAGSPGVGQYSYSAGVWTFNSGDAARAIVVTYTYAYAGPTYTPNTSIVATVDYEDYNSTGATPLIVTRADPADAYNHVKLEIKDRANAYNAAVGEWKDQGLVDQFGQIDNPTVQAHEVCDVTIGQIVAQLIGQRDAYIRNTYEFTLGAEFCWLEPGDLVYVNEPHIPLVNFAVRLRTLEENDRGEWECRAEEYPGAVGSVVGTASQPVNVSAGTTVNPNIAPGSVNPPAIFEPNAALVSPPQVWIAASGATPANWGGCAVYLSFDNVNFNYIGTISAAAGQGVLTASLPDYSGANPDTVDTLAIDLTESGVVLNTDATNADGAAGRTLCIITPSYTTVVPNNGECIAYGAAATTGTYTFNLTDLYRSLYGTTHSLHASGSYFTRLNLNLENPPGNSVLAYDLPAQYVGQTLYFKFCSFNTFGNALQSQSAVTTYSYTPSGAGFGGGTGGVPTTPTGLAATPGIGQNVLTWNVNPTTDNVQYYKVYAASGLSQPFSAATQVGTSTSPNFIHTGLGAGSNWTYFLTAHNAVGDSAHTAGVNCTTSSTVNNLFRLSGNLAGQPTAAQVLFEVEMVGGEALPINLTGSVGGCDVAPTGAIVCTLYKNGTSIGTMNIAAGAAAATFTFSAAVSFASGDVLTFQAPASVDATLSGLHYTFIGTR